MDPNDANRRRGRAAILRYVHETYGPGQYRYDLERIADDDDALPDAPPAAVDVGDSSESSVPWLQVIWEALAPLQPAAVLLDGSDEHDAVLVAHIPLGPYAPSDDWRGSCLEFRAVATTAGPALGVRLVRSPSSSGLVEFSISGDQQVHIVRAAEHTIVSLNRMPVVDSVIEVQIRRFGM